MWHLQYAGIYKAAWQQEVSATLAWHQAQAPQKVKMTLDKLAAWLQEVSVLQRGSFSPLDWIWISQKPLERVQWMDFMVSRVICWLFLSCNSQIALFEVKCFRNNKKNCFWLPSHPPWWLSEFSSSKDQHRTSSSALVYEQMLSNTKCTPTNLKPLPHMCTRGSPGKAQTIVSDLFSSSQKLLERLCWTVSVKWTGVKRLVKKKKGRRV